MSVVFNNTSDKVELTATTGSNGIYHSWNGTILTITSDSGTSACDLKGAKGDDGPRGPQGLPGDANLIEAVDKAEKAAADAETALSQLGTARDEAVAAAAQVKAIVAGNEAYTKAESDSRFANAIKPTATGEVATANDSGNYPLQGLSIYGKTTQNGTPTPTTPIDLVNIGVGSIGVKVCGKNLARDIYINNDALSQYASCMFIETDLLPNTTYTLSFNAKSGNWYYLNENITSYKSFVSTNERISVSFTTKEDLANIDGYSTLYGRWIILKNGSNNTEHNFTNIQLEYGTAATPYELYKDGGSITLNTPNGLPGIPVSSGGNYTDSTGQQWVADEIDLAKGVYRKRVIGKTINGSETITYDGDAFNIAGVFPADGKAYKYGLCSHYKIYTNYNEYIKNVNSMCVWGTGAIRIRHGGSTDAAAFKLWLADNPITVYLPYTTPTETPLTAAEIAAYKALYSQYPNTTVYTDANAGIAATYVADTKLYIDNKFNELSTALVAMGG